MIRKAVIPIAGFGTRFLPITKSIPKEMLPVFDKPLIHYAYQEAIEAGIEEIIFIVSQEKETCINYFDHNPNLNDILIKGNKLNEIEKLNSWLPRAGNIICIRQQRPLGLGHAIWCARNLINEPFVVLLPDEISFKSNCLKDMIELYNKYSSKNIIAVSKVLDSETHKYGIIDYEEQENQLLKIIKMIEKPLPHDAPSNLAITGKYILQPEIFVCLEKLTPGKNNEIQLTDALDMLVQQQEFYAHIDQYERYDCGNPLGLLEANIAYSVSEAISDIENKKKIKKILEDNLARLK